MKIGELIKILEKLDKEKEIYFVGEEEFKVSKALYIDGVKSIKDYKEYYQLESVEDCIFEEVSNDKYIIY